MELNQVAEGLMAFIRAERWSELQAAILQCKQALFDAQAEAMFCAIAQANVGNPEAMEVIDLRRQHFALLRSYGLGALYAHLQGYGRSLTVEPELIQQLSGAGSAAELEDVFDRHPELMLVYRHVTEQDIYPARPPDVGHSPVWSEWAAAQQSTPEQRIDVSMRALKEADRDLFPALWAELHVSLARDWADRTTGDAAVNAAASQAHYALAQQVLTPDDYPIEWARMRAGMGNALVERGAAGNKAMLEQAIAHYQAAIETLHPDRASALTLAVLGLQPKVLAVERAQLCARLAEMYAMQPGDTQILSEQALPHLLEALDVFAAQRDHVGEAQIRLLLGQIAQNRPSEDPDARREEARQAFERVLELVSPDEQPRLWAIARLKLGDLVRKDIGVSSPMAHLRDAQVHFTEALEVLECHGLDVEWTTAAACGLAAIACEQMRDGGAFDPAHDTLARVLARVPLAKRHVAAALRLSLARLHVAYAGVSSTAHLEEAELLMLHALQDYDRTQFPTAVLMILEELGRLRFRARRWADALDTLSQAAALNDELLFAAERDGTIQSRVERSPDIFPCTAYCLLKLGRPADALLVLEQGKNRAFKRARVESGALSFEVIAAAVPPQGAFVVPVATDLGASAIVLPAGARALTDANVLDWGLTNSDLAGLAAGDDKHPGWINAWVAWKQGGAHEDWQDAIRRNCETVWQTLMQPIHERLNSLGVLPGSSVVLFPHSWLSHIPLHAASGLSDGKTICFGEMFVTSYAPSFAIYMRGAPMPADKPEVLSVVDPLGDLPFAALEAGLVTRAFPAKAVTPLVGERATPEAFLDRATGSTHVHLLCHGYFHMRDALSSGVMFSGHRPLTVREIASACKDLSRVRLLTMAGCETGLSQFVRRYGRNIFTHAPSEFAGLVMAWLGAGVQTVISAMWPVDDFPTALLMGEFYRRYSGEGEAPPLALFGAQRWLRELDREALLEVVSHELDALKDNRSMPDKRLRRGLVDVQSLLLEDYRTGDRPFDHPHYWAAFVATGSRVR